MPPIHGIGVSAGIAVGPALILHRPPKVPANEPPTINPESDLERVKQALATVSKRLTHRAKTAPEAAHALLEATAMMAADPGLASAIGSELAKGLGPQTALHTAVAGYCEMLTELGGYMAERVADLRDVEARTLAELQGLPEPGVPTPPVPSVLLAHDLAPADTATLDPSLIIGIATEIGGPTSHTAILAAQLGIPAVIQATGVTTALPGGLVAINGSTGKVELNATAELVAEYTKRQAQRDRATSRVKGPGQTADGHAVQILANIGTEADALTAAAAKLEGVGLFRTEFLYLNSQAAPTMQAQTEIYTRVFKAFPGQKVVVRTLDAGADKPLPFADVAPEDNPALGLRGIRLQRKLDGLLDTQLAAIAAAAAQTTADVWVMAPMIATPAEARWFTAKAIEHGLQNAGTMIEIPSAAIRATQVLENCAFASIGSNDLSQYLFAADRMSGELAELLSGWQPALWELIAEVAKAGEQLNKPVGICGEIGGDPLLACVATGLGISSLSMAPSRAPAVKAMLAAHSHDQCQQMAAAAIAAATVDQARAAVTRMASPEAVVLL